MQPPLTRLPFWIEADQCEFPAPELALEEPNGLLAIGANLSLPCLLNAYRHGIFPWYSAGQPIMWWSPDPRAVLFPGELKVSRSLRRTLARGRLQVTFDRDFAAVVAGCAAPRGATAGADDTWITTGMAAAYQRLHDAGYAHSVEVWQEGRLVGGLYGVALGQVFFGESMFHRVTDASKVALVHLVEQLRAQRFQLIDCQVTTPHLLSLGAREIPRQDFLTLLRRHCRSTAQPRRWRHGGGQATP